MPNHFCEFFAGGGMARAGLGPEWECVFANDFDSRKARAYSANWSDGVLVERDVRGIEPDEIPNSAQLYWASFPCQDLSLAGMGAGLRGDRSGTFWPYWALVRSKVSQQRAPKLIVLENVCGTLTSHSGADFEAICQALYDSNFRFGAVIVDARHFVPQSRPRLFIVAVSAALEIPSHLRSSEPSRLWHGSQVGRAYGKLPPTLQKNWVWWNLAAPPARSLELADLIEDQPADVSWHTLGETKALVGMMSEEHRQMVDSAVLSGIDVTGTIYKRTRFDHNGNKVQRAEVRFDGLAGCLRTPSGGSSRQLIIRVRDGAARTRLLSSREAARLMGLPDSYKLPQNYNEAYHLLGDGLVVPVVRFLSDQLLRPLVHAASRTLDAAA